MGLTLGVVVINREFANEFCNRVKTLVTTLSLLIVVF